MRIASCPSPSTANGSAISASTGLLVSTGSPRSPASAMPSLQCRLPDPDLTFDEQRERFPRNCVQEVVNRVDLRLAPYDLQRRRSDLLRQRRQIVVLGARDGTPEGAYHRGAGGGGGHPHGCRESLDATPNRPRPVPTFRRRRRRAAALDGQRGAAVPSRSSRPPLPLRQLLIPRSSRTSLPEGPSSPANPATTGAEKPCDSREFPPIPAQPGTAMTGLSRRRSRVRVPSLPSLLQRFCASSRRHVPCARFLEKLADLLPSAGAIDRVNVEQLSRQFRLNSCRSGGGVHSPSPEQS